MRWLGRLLRFAVCAVALWWVGGQVDWRQLGVAWGGSDKAVLATAVVIFAPAPLLQSVRFVWMLRTQDIHISYWEAIKLSYLGNFFNNFVPAGAVGGDVVKAYYVAQHTHRKTEAITAVFLDRVVGLLSFVVYAVVGMAFVLDDRTRDVAVWLGAFCLFLAIGGSLMLSRRFHAMLRLNRLEGRTRLAEQINRTAAAMLRFRGHSATAVLALVATLVAHLILFWSFSVAAVGFGMKADFVGYCAFLAISILVAAVPVSPGGLGTMEAAMVYLLVGGGFGDREHVILLALAIRAIQLFWALPGGTAYLAGSCRADLALVAEPGAGIPVSLEDG